jgi:flagellar export protein FliJ
VIGIRCRNSHISAARRRVEVRTERAKEAEESAEAARPVLPRASQERKMFDKLKDHALERHMAGERHAEQMAVDETVSYKIGTALTHPHNA